MKKIVINLLLISPAMLCGAQDSLWTMDACMRYAVENSIAVRKQLHANDTYEAEYNAAKGAFFPSLSMDVSAQYNFGRAVDPETNTYINTTTFNNYYEGHASCPVFDGGQLVNQFRLAKTNRQAGMNDLQKARDDLALNTLEAFVNVAYYQGTTAFAREKLAESERTLLRIRRQEELGMKGKADVAQVEAQVAGDDYNLTLQQNLYHTALLKLKEYMNYPYDATLAIDTASVAQAAPGLSGESAEDIYRLAREVNPIVLQAGYRLKASRLQYLVQKGRLFPAVSFSAGVYTSYYENLKGDIAPTAFRSQFGNNRGEYLSLRISIPLYDGLARIREVRRARNNVRIAQAEELEALRRLQTVVEESVNDRERYAKERLSMERKLRSDLIAYEVTLRKFEEGLTSPIELQTSANSLIESKANLLQKQLMYLLKCRQVDYYNGKALIEE